MIGKADGRIDIWDFLDQSHKESLSHNIGSQKLTVISFLSLRRSPLIMAVGDSNGYVHIIEIARHASKDTEREKNRYMSFGAKKKKESLTTILALKFDLKSTVKTR
jgi:hypothetical protein